MLARGHGDMGGGDTVQMCKCGFAACKGAKVKTGEGLGLGLGLGLEIREARRLRGSVEQRDPAIKGKPETGISFSGLGSRPSGPGFGCSAPGTGSGPAPVPVPEDPHLIPDCRDPRPEDVLVISPTNISKS